jgi:hypothetical protein
MLNYNQTVYSALYSLGGVGLTGSLLERGRDRAHLDGQLLMLSLLAASIFSDLIDLRQVNFFKFG